MTQDDLIAAREEWTKRIQSYATDADIAAAKANGELPPLEHFHKSSSYLSHLRHYAKQHGALKRDERKKFRQLREDIIERVLKETDILLVTCSTAGSEMVANCFQASIVLMDEAGQATMAAMAVPLSTQTRWKALFAIGDTRQLQSTVLSVQAIEVKANAKMSPLGLWLAKGVKYLVLGEQYRMAPAISKFPSRYFYGGALINSLPVLQDNIRRQRARAISRKHYGIKVNLEDSALGGSEYWLIDVSRGVSRVEPNGTSLQNHANTEAIWKLLGQFLQAGFKGSEIGILSFYTGQKKLMGSVLERSPDNKIRLSTVDRFQGQQIEVIILDVVAANDDSVEAEQDDEEFGIKFEHLTSHVSNPNRVCMGITRPKDCLVVVGQFRTMLSRSKRKRTAICELAMDALDRELLYRDNTTQGPDQIDAEKT